MIPIAERRRDLDIGRSRDLTRDTLAVIATGGLIVITAWIVRPFLSALLWASMIVISTWPLLLSLQARLWRKRGMAAAVMTFLLLLVLLLPLGFFIGTLVGNVDKIVAWVQSLNKLSLPSPPAWVGNLPVAGPKISAAWLHVTAEGPGSLSAHGLPYAGRFLQWFVARAGGVGAMILHFLLTVIISAVLYMKGEAVARGVRLFAYRLAGQNGEKAAILAANCVRAVALGVVLTAIVQTAIAGIGFAIAAVPGMVLLTAAVFMLCLAQVGPLLVMLPAVIWKFYAGDTWQGSILLVFLVVSGTIDNFLRPILIKKSADLPLLLIFAGVIGGMIGLGVAGIFVGPVILAVTYVLLEEWVKERAEPEKGAASSGAVQRTAR